MAGTIAYQMLAIAVAILQRQAIHNKAVSRRDIDRDYDYVVVGAGASGSLVAATLAEYGEKVLLLEAGSGLDVLNDIPAAWPLVRNPKTDWGYSTVPQKYSQQMWLSNQTTFPAGKVLGGGSSIGLTCYIRGNAADYDNWDRKYGCGEEWSYRQLLPYFREVETFANASSFPGDGEYYGTRGPVGVAYAMHRDPIHHNFEMAWNLEGFPTIDLHGPTQKGVGILQQTTDPSDHWFRSSAPHAYLYPNLDLPKLHILTESLVTRIIFQNGTVASGVRFEHHGKVNTVWPRKEIILAAGAINTPKLLMLSGIGPKKDLEALKIETIQDLPVGRKLKDHPCLTLPFLVINQSSIDWGTRMVERTSKADDLYQFWVEGTGPLTTRGFTVAYHASTGNADKNWPDTGSGLFIYQVSEQTLESYKYSTNYTAWKKYYRPLVNNQRYFEVMIVLFRHNSTGSVKLASAEHTDAPLIDPNYFSDPRDLSAIVDMMALTYATAEKAYFRKFARPYKAVVPGCETEVCRSRGSLSKCRKYLTCVARMRATTCWGPTGTAPMGTHSDAVLDPDLRVKGVDKLRVVDTSAFPEPSNGVPLATAFPFARKAADLILYDEHLKGNLHVKWAPVSMNVTL